MSSPFRLTRKPRALERDTLVLALDDGRSIDIQRVRDPRARRLRLSVDERGARLTLPPRASLVSGDRFLREHRDWLLRQLAAHADDDDATALVRGETRYLPLRGAQLPLHWQDGRYTHLQYIADRDNVIDAVSGDATNASGHAALPAAHDRRPGLWFTVPARAGDAAMRRALRDFYEAQARADLGRWLSRHLPTLPRAPSRIRFKVMSSQWGSLAPDGALSLDLSLVLGRPEAFEYVLVHELCHLLHADHSPAFWREVEARFPAWRAQRDYFHAHGRCLKAGLRRLVWCPANSLVKSRRGFGPETRREGEQGRSDESGGLVSPPRTPRQGPAKA